MKRLLSLDFLRGFAIWMMIVFHVFMYSWSGNEHINNVQYFLNMPLPYMIAMIILAQLSTWAGLFILISMCVNVIAVQRRIDEGTPLEKMRNKQLLTGFLILILGYFTEMFTSYNGLFGYSVENGYLDWTGVYIGLLSFKALNVIGLCILICSTVIYFLYRDGGHDKIRRNIIILVILTLIVLIMTPILNMLIHNFIYPWWSTDDTSAQFRPYTTPGELILRVMLIALAGYMEPLFPFLSTAFIGTIFGIVLSQEHPDPRFPKIAMLSGFGAICLGVLLLVAGVDINPPINARQEIPWFLLSLGGQVLSLAFLLKIVEFDGHIQGFKRYSTFWRRWGMMAMTIYCFQFIDYPVKLLLFYIFGLPAQLRGTLNFGWTFLLLVLTILTWELILHTWSRVEFKYSYEWFVIQLTTKSQGIKSARTKVDVVVYDVEPVQYGYLSK